MADFTRRFKFTTLDQPTDRIDLQGYKFTDADRIQIDRLLRFAVEVHTHSGASVASEQPAAPLLSTRPTGGSIRASTAAHYRYGLVDARGQEYIGSKTATVHTATPASAPAYAPRLSQLSGTLEPGEYLYALSACTNGDNTQETILGPFGAGTLATFGAWSLDLPPLPSGADFFNIYRKGPYDTELFYWASTYDANERVFLDTGNIKPNPYRTAPRDNTTNMTNSVVVMLQGGLPQGIESWRLYRTYDPSNWDHSLLDWIGGRITDYVDDGRETKPGFPPATSAGVGGAPKIRLDTDVTGTPPSSIVNATTQLVYFNSDLVVEGPGTWYWPCTVERAKLISLRASLGRDRAPDLRSVKVGLERLVGSAFEPITYPFSSTPILSTISVGQIVGSQAILIGAHPSDVLIPGQCLRMMIWQDGHTVVPDVTHDLTLTVSMYVRDGASSTSYQWETT